MPNHIWHVSDDEFHGVAIMSFYPYVQKGAYSEDKSKKIKEITKKYHHFRRDSFLKFSKKKKIPLIRGF